MFTLPLITFTLTAPFLAASIFFFIEALRKKNRAQMVICSVVMIFLVYRIIMAGISDAQSYNQVYKMDKAAQQQPDRQKAK